MNDLEQYITVMEQRLNAQKERIVGSGYTHHVGRKFNKDGTCKEFMGGTIISFLDKSNAIYDLVLQIRDEYRRCTFGRKLSFLPPYSYHVTVFIVFNDPNRDSDHWSEYLPGDTSVDDTHRFMIPRVNRVVPPGPLDFHPTYVDGDTVRLRPKTKNVANSLQDYRNQLSKECGVRFKDHDTYSYHITFSYLIEKLTESEFSDLLEINRKCTETISGFTDEIALPSPVYTKVFDMCDFRIPTQHSSIEATS